MRKVIRTRHLNIVVVDTKDYWSVEVLHNNTLSGISPKIGKFRLFGGEKILPRGERHKNEEWLRNEFLMRERTIKQIAWTEGKCPGTIAYFLSKFGIRKYKRKENRGI